MGADMLRKKLHEFIHNHTRAILFLVILLVQCFTIIEWGTKKEGFNVDEMFTLEGSKQGGYDMQYWDYQENFYGTEHTGEEFKQWLITYPDELLLNQDIYEVMNALVHRNLYYTLINLASTIYPGKLTCWIGIGLNMVFFVVSQLLLYNIARRISNHVYALLTVSIYGFSAGAVSTVLYNRCYMLLTLLVLTIILLYLKFPSLKYSWSKAGALLILYTLLLISYKTHEFGIILFGIVTILFLMYYVVKKMHSSILWIILGYGIPSLIGFPLFYKKIANSFAGVTTLFWNYLSQGSIDDFINQGYISIITVSKHLFAHTRIVLLLLCVYVILTLIKAKKNSYKIASSLKQNFILFVLFLLVVLYYTILIMGGAAGSLYSWKYLSPLYPIIILLTTMTLSVILSQNILIKAIPVMYGLLFAITTCISYHNIHVSELYIGEKVLKETIAAKYSDYNGIMVQLDTSGEISLYKPAALWPDDSHILVLKHSTFENEIMHYTNTDAHILLWLTVDYEQNEIIELLKAHTIYTNVTPLFSNPFCYIYECSK